MQFGNRVAKARKHKGQQTQNGAAVSGAVRGRAGRHAGRARSVCARGECANQNFARMPAPNVLPFDSPLMWSFMYAA